ncbi:MAG: exostosin family-domain-containing protein [Monoraphidium minutum]|nr:MAG: exostosin family-domain-containing protein [Monoraphidium minutum]
MLLLLGCNSPRALDVAAALAPGGPPRRRAAPGGEGGGGGAAAGWRRECAPGCTDRGNCNAEEGRCECPWGFAGPTCAESLLPACALAPGAAAVQCGELLPRACACLRQCARFFCAAAPGGGCEAHRDLEGPRCFELTAGGGGGGGGQGPFLSEGVYSAVPEGDTLGGHAVQWFKGVSLGEGGAAAGGGNGSGDQGQPPGRRRISRQEALQLDGGVVAQPLSQCPGNCSLRGQCVSRGGEARCACWRGYDGAACEFEHDSFCLNGCQGRGACAGGFCHCKPGYWGADCSRSRAFPPDGFTLQTAAAAAAAAAAGSTPGAPPPPPPPAGRGAWGAPADLKIYVYELPSDVAFDFEAAAAFEFDVGFAYHHPNYIAYRHFRAMLMNDSSVRTEDPREASLFFVPAESYAYSSNIGDVLPHLRRVMAYVRDALPFFNATGGRDHVLWLPNDRGACFIPQDDPLVTHFGLAALPPGAAAAGSDFAAAAAAGGGACHRPGRDVVAAPVFAQQEELTAETYLKPEGRGAAAAAAADPTSAGGGGANATGGGGGGAERRGPLLFFAGDVRESDKTYSGGARQARGLFTAVHRLFKSHPGVRLVTGGLPWERYVSELRAARFCLAPYGHGWGVRLSEAVAAGCVPVIVQDGVQQPYEDLLPYAAFSLRLPTPGLPQLLDALAAVTPDHYSRLRAGLGAHWRAFLWGPAAGGRAYEVTVASLRRRATAALGGQFV